MTSMIDDEARGELGRYLAARGIDPSLAGGPVGDRYLARRAAGLGRTPAEAVGIWFADLLGGSPGEAEAIGWIAFLVASRPASELLGALEGDALQALTSRAPRPAFESPLSMPIQQLARARSRRPAPTSDVLRAPGAA